ncbi:MAG: hypothetical protein GY898_05465 [Proteobacteria bacterium]|nr:hypothetical protein [Pseudomonadota bacterium]
MLPTRTEAAATAALAAALVGVVASPAFASWVKDLAFVMLEVIGRVLDRPTSLVVFGYGVVVAAALAIELRGSRPLRRELIPTHLVVCLLALLGQGYLFLLAAQLRLTWLLIALPVFLLGAAFLAPEKGIAPYLTPPPAPGSGTDIFPFPAAPIVTVFVVLHVLVEGAAGHILTPWLHAVSDLAARISRIPVLYWPLVVVPSVLGPAALGWWGLKRGLRPVSWPHFDPRRLVDFAAIPSLAALAVVGLHYTTTMWGCPPADAPGLTRLSTASGAFDLEVSADGSKLLASRREPRELLLVDLASGSTRTASTARPTDSLFDRTEPETLLALEDGRFLVLLASSDSEQGNGLAVFDPDSLALGERLAARGVSDVVSDGDGGVWISMEFAGRLIQIDPTTGEELERLDLGRAETNSIIVEASSDSAWSAGLWMDSYLRRVDLRSGQEVAWGEVGTHQWDLALSSSERVVFVPRLMHGRVEAFQADTLERLGSLPDAFGVRPIEITPDGQTVVTGNLYTGRIIARGVSDGTIVFDRRIGGHVKALEIGPNGRIFAGSNCGVFELSR